MYMQRRNRMRPKSTMFRTFAFMHLAHIKGLLNVKHFITIVLPGNKWERERERERERK